MVLTQALTGCAAYRPDDLGMQTGVVRKIYPTGVTPASFPECVVPVASSRQPMGRYVEIEFANVESKRYVNSFVSDEVNLKLNDKVTVSSPYCVGSHKPEVIPR